MMRDQAGITEHQVGAGGLEAALWDIQQGNMDVGFLQ